MSSPSTTALVVDDDTAVRRLTSLMLMQGGFALIEAASGAEALAVLESRPGEVGLLVTDLQMPEMSGTELARQAMAQDPRLRVLFVTGFSREAVDAAALAPDRVSVVEKPFTLDQLLSRARDVLSR